MERKKLLAKARPPPNAVTSHDIPPQFSVSNAKAATTKTKKYHHFIFYPKFYLRKQKTGIFSCDFFGLK
jgi:hypothetical protein